MRYLIFLLFGILSDVVFKRLNKTTVKGKENIPDGVGILFLVNHIVLADSLLVNRNLVNYTDLFFNQKKIAYNAPDKKNFFSHSIKGKIVALLKCIPVDRDIKSPKKMEEQLSRLSSVLDDNNLIIYFEGTRSKDGNIGECKRGVTEVILQANPRYIIPVKITGLENVLPRGKKYYTMFLSFKRHKCTMTIGKPIDFSSIVNAPIEKDEKVEIIKKLVREKVVELS